MQNFEQLINTNNKNITVNKAKEYNSLSFAFIGDAVHTLFVRTHLITNSTAQAGKLHTQTNGFVQASAQAFVFDELEKELTEEEKAIAKRARNIKNKTVAKNAKLEDYKKATAFEALIGHLYMTAQYERMNELLNKSLIIMEQK